MTDACAACGREAPLDHLIVFWPVGRPEERRYVHRPSMAEFRTDRNVTCFHAVVGGVGRHSIAATT